MAYIGAEPVPGQNREIDDISSGFNGSATSFTLQVSSTNVSPESANNILVNLGGVMQNPGTDYTIAASTITFTTAPASGLSFWALILGAGINTATVADDTIGASKLIDTAVTAGSYTTADITVDAQGRITAAASGTISGAEIADQAVTNAKVNNSAAIDVSKLSGVMPLAGGSFTGDVTFTGASANIVFDKSDNALEFADNARLRLGASNDLELLHDGTDNHIIGGSPINIDTGAGEVMAKFVTNGSVELYYDNAKKFETVTAGVSITGQVSSDTIHVGDGTTGIQVGDSSDLKIYHDGSDSYISNVGTGELIIQPTTNETAAVFRTNGSVELFHNNTKKFETSAAGGTLSGTLSFPDGDAGTNTEGGIKLGASGDLHIYHDGNDSHIKETGTGDLIITGKNNIKFLDYGTNETMAKMVSEGAVELYHDNSKKLFTTSSGITAGNPDTSQTNVVGAQVGFFAGAKSLFASATGLIQNQVGILDTATSAAAGTGGALTFGGYITSTSSTYYATIEGIKENSTSNNYAGKLKFLTRAHNVANMNEAMVIDSAGRVGIGSAASSPDRLLDVIKGGTNVSRFQQTTNNTGDDHNCITIRHAASISGQNGVAIIFQNSSGSVVGKIDHGQSTTQYRTTSDYRLKENEVAISDGITRLKTLKPYRFNFTAEPDRTVDGFFAHEVTAVPESISGTKDETQDILYTEEDTIPSGKKVGDVKETIPVYQGIDQSKLVPLLTAALQEAITKIETLETKVAALEAA